MNQYPTMPPIRGPLQTSARQNPSITPAVRALMQRQDTAVPPPAQPNGAGMVPGAAPVQLGQAMRQPSNQFQNPTPQFGQSYDANMAMFQDRMPPMQSKPMQSYGNSENLPIDFSNYNPAPFTKQPFNQGNWQGQISTQDPSTRKLPQVPQYLAERIRAFGTI